VITGEDEGQDVESRIEDLERRVGANHADISALSERADASEAQASIDRAMLAELQADGVLSREHAEQMDEALRSSRIIGAALGMIMAGRLVTQDEAFAILKEASQRTNRKLRDLAAEIVECGRLGAV
jgi:hypothetical protein